MPKARIFCLIAIGGGLLSATSLHVRQKVKGSEVTEMLYFQPLSVLSLVQEGDKLVRNDSVSRVARQLHQRIITAHSTDLRISKTFSWQDSSLNKSLRGEIQVLLNEAARRETPDSVTITRLVDSVLEAKHVRFGLITVANGFTRTKKNYSDEMAKGAFTFGLAGLPFKGRSAIYVLIADAKNNNLAYYDVSDLRDRDPLDSTRITIQYKKLFKGFLPFR